MIKNWSINYAQLHVSLVAMWSTDDDRLISIDSKRTKTMPKLTEIVNQLECSAYSISSKFWMLSTHLLLLTLSLSVWTGGMKNRWYVAVLRTYETLLKFNIKKTCDVPQQVRCGRFRSIDNMYNVRKVRKVDKHNNKPNETYEIRYTLTHTHRHGTECRECESAADTHSICEEKERQIIIIAMKCN